MIRTLLIPMGIFACVFMVSLSHGITNIESTRLNNTQEGTSGNVSLSLDGRIGSSDKVALGTSAKLIRAYHHDEWIALISRDYAEVDGEVNTDESLIHLRYLTKHSPHWGHEVFTQYQEDQFSFLAKRSLLGAGIRYTLSSEHPLQQANNIGLGLFYEVEDYTNTSTKNENNVRLNLYWAYKNKVHDNILYTSTLYFQPDTDQFSDQKGLWQNALTISVTSTISLNLSWDMEHDTRTPNGANDTETSYNSVLIYNF
jgi:putative salt-induced outer membrane protein YdiY